MKTNHVIGLISCIREKANRLLAAELAACGLDGLVPSHGSILAALFQEGHLSMKEIAGRIHKDKSTVTALVDKLEDHGYVRRCPHETCGRTTMIELTAKGRKYEDCFRKISEKLIAAVYQGIGEKEKEALITTLEKIEKNL